MDLKNSEISSDITHLESLQPTAEEKRDIYHIKISAGCHFGSSAFGLDRNRSHTVLTSTSREMTFKFQTVKKTLTKNFSLCFFSLLKELYKIITKINN